MSSKARLNWLLRQIRADCGPEYLIRFNWPGRAEATQATIAEAHDDPAVIEKDRSHLQVSSFEVVAVQKKGARFAQQGNFIADLEHLVPEFYEKVGQNLSAWKKPAPKVKEERVSVAEISEEADSRFGSED